jgi:hypothetical protein
MIETESTNHHKHFTVLANFIPGFPSFREIYLWNSFKQADDGFVASRNLWLIIFNNSYLCVTKLC